ncbi:MAG: hypothetical protein Q4C72_06400 [Eubacteriales bacterium]|nr:hypothetical protein [Eubacteriales bacterium]
MPWCPKCRAEYREGFTTCNTCHIPLIDHEPDGTEQIPEIEQPEEKWLRDDPKRERILRIVRTLAVVVLALLAALLLENMGI